MIDSVGKRAIDTAISLRLFAALGGEARSCEELERELGLSVRGLRPLLSLLASLELLFESEGRYVVREETGDFLTRWPETRASIVDAPDWQALERVVRTGRPARQPIEGKADGGDFFSGVVSTLFGFHLPIARAYAAQVPETVKNVLDLGAGSGVWSLALARERPEVRVTAVDLERVLREMTEGFLVKHGVREQYELRPGSYHEVELEESFYDLIYLGHVIHSEGWEASRRLLGRCHKALHPGGLLAVAEWIASEPRSDDYHACLFDLNMLMFTQDGLVFTATEMEELATECGFVEPRWVEGPGKYPVLEMRRGP